MRRAALLAALALAGCSSPVMTRIDAAAPAPLPPRASFALADMPDSGSLLHGQARDMVAAALRQRGWRETGAESADFLLSVTLADRPATITLRDGDDFGRPGAVRAAAADRSNNRGCARRDHRLRFTLAERVSGNTAFASAASEYHCKGRLTDSLPHLVSAAVDRLEAGSGSVEIARSGVR